MPGRRILSASLKSLILLVAVLMAGCNEEEKLYTAMDPTSRLRLMNIAEDAPVYVSLKCDRLPEELPALGENGQKLGQAGTTILLDVPRSALSRLAGIDGVRGATVWGSSESGRKLDRGIRNQLLERLDRDSDDDETLPMIGQFREGAHDVRARLEKMGVQTRTVAGTVVTIDASPEGVFELIAMEDLVQLTQPRMLTPN